MMVRDFQSSSARKTRAQMQEAEGRLPDSLVACIGGGSNAMGLFHPFLDDAKRVEISASRRRDGGVDTGEHAASLTGGTPGVLHGNRTYLLHGWRRPDPGSAIRSPPGSIIPASAPNMPGCMNQGRVTYVPRPMMRRSRLSSCCSKLEGIIARARAGPCLAHVIKLAPKPAERSPDGHESVRPRRQGRLQVADILKGKKK
jgi:tryptophan synthase beta chain